MFALLDASELTSLIDGAKRLASSAGRSLW
jgi:hypothetical protein